MSSAIKYLTQPGRTQLFILATKLQIKRPMLPGSNEADLKRRDCRATQQVLYINTRICRPVRLTQEDCKSGPVCNFPDWK
jgi:hypothetical protein